MSARAWVLIAAVSVGLPLGFLLGRGGETDLVSEQQRESDSQLTVASENAPSPSALPSPAVDKRAESIGEAASERLAKIERGKGIEDYHARYKALGSVFREWGRSDPVPAFEAWANTPEVAGMGLCDLIIANLVMAEGFEATLARTANLENLKARLEARRYLGSHIYMLSDRAAAADSLLDEVADDERKSVMSSAVGSWRLKAGIEEVWSWVESKSDRFDAAEIALLQRSAAQGLVASNPKRAIEWLLSRATDESRPGHLASIATAWARNEPNAAAKWLSSLPPGSQNDEALASFSRQICRDDPESAAHWASNIVGKGERDQALNHVIAVWRTIDPEAAARFDAGGR